jgi:hypothetical protein
VAEETFNVVGEGAEKGEVVGVEEIAPWEEEEGVTAPQALRDHSEAEEAVKTEGAHLLVGVEVFVALLEAEVVLPPR